MRTGERKLKGCRRSCVLGKKPAFGWSKRAKRAFREKQRMEGTLRMMDHEVQRAWGSGGVGDKLKWGASLS